VAFCKNYADDKENRKLHQLENLKAGNIVNEFNSFQSSRNGFNIILRLVILEM